MGISAAEKGKINRGGREREIKRTITPLPGEAREGPISRSIGSLRTVGNCGEAKGKGGLVEGRKQKQDVFLCCNAL